MPTEINLAIDHTKIDATLTNFPVMINLSALANVWTEITADADRKKLKVKSTLGVEYYVEIECFDTVTETGILWAKIPSISDSVDTTFILEVGLVADNTTYVGDSGALAAESVWDANFIAVYHMNQDPNGDAAGCILDSTSNDRNGTPAGTMLTADLVDADFGKALDLDGGDDYIQLSAKIPIGAKTIELSFYATDAAHANAADVLFGETSLSDNSYGNWMYWNHSTHKISWYIFKSVSATYIITSETSELSPSTQYKIACTWDGTTGANKAIIYVNGSSDVTATAASTETVVPTNNTRIGDDHSATQRNFEGQISEVRISDIERSAAWIKATNASNTDALVSELTTHIITISLPALTCAMGSSITASIPALTSVMVGGVYINASIAALTCILDANKLSFSGNLIDSLGALTMTGETDQYREVEASLAALTCEMVGVANRLGIDIELPAIISDSHAAGHLSESIPGLTMDAEGSNGILAQLAGEFSELSMIAMSGAFLSDSMAAPVVEIVGTNQVVTKLSSSFSALQATISGKHENLPTIATNLPSLQAALISDNGAVCTINTHFPSLTFNASGYIESINNLTTYLPYMSCNIAASLNGSNTIDFMLHELMMLGIIDNLADDTILRHIRGQIR